MLMMKPMRAPEQLDSEATAGNFAVRLNRALACPQCGRAVRAFHCEPQHSNDAIALDCPGCHTRLLTVEVTDEIDD